VRKRGSTKVKAPGVCPDCAQPGRLVEQWDSTTADGPRLRGRYRCYNVRCRQPRARSGNQRLYDNGKRQWVETLLAATIQDENEVKR
jgi:hypothetical protein